MCVLRFSHDEPGVGGFEKSMTEVKYPSHHIVSGYTSITGFRTWDVTLKHMATVVPARFSTVNLLFFPCDIVDSFEVSH